MFYIDELMKEEDAKFIAYLQQARDEAISKVADLAYFKWIDAGYPHGRDQEFWFEAEKEIWGR